MIQAVDATTGHPINAVYMLTIKATAGPPPTAPTIVLTHRPGSELAMMHPYHAKLARVLERMGGLYTVQDILNLIAIGKMQSFTEGDSWAVTQIVICRAAKCSK